ACDSRDLASLGIDQHRSWHPHRPAYGLKLLKYLCFMVVEEAEPGQACFPQEIPGLLRIAGIDVDGNHLEIRSPKLLLQRRERRHFPSAGHAPGCPQVHQDRLPAPVRQLLGPAFGILESEVW